MHKSPKDWEPQPRISEDVPAYVEVTVTDFYIKGALVLNPV